MDPNNLSIIHILENLRKNLIISYVDKKYSPKEIMDELKRLNLNYQGVGESRLKSNILSIVQKRWNEEEKIWEDDKQENIFPWIFTEEDEKRFWNSYLANISPNQAETLLKDMKEILSNVKQITQSAERITRDIDYIVSRVKQYDEEE